MIVLTNTTYNKTVLSLFTSRRDFRRWPVASQLGSPEAARGRYRPAASARRAPEFSLRGPLEIQALRGLMVNTIRALLDPTCFCPLDPLVSDVFFGARIMYPNPPRGYREPQMYLPDGRPLTERPQAVPP